jgi:hypothetical protein
MIEPMMFAGETRFFACTGVLIGHHKSTTRILTSASLVRIANKNEIDGKLKVCNAKTFCTPACLFHMLIPTFIADSSVTSR